MKTKGYTVTGTSEMVSQGMSALGALPNFLDKLGEDASAAEIRIYENMPIEAVIFDGDIFTTYVWNGETWKATF